MAMIDISGLDKAHVLLARYNGSHTQGLSFMGSPGRTVTIRDAKAAIQDLDGERLFFDYWMGHVLKVDITGDEFDDRLYDRDNYPGAAFFTIENLRKELASNVKSDIPVISD